jgi:hypothetical protein
LDFNKPCYTASNSEENCVGFLGRRLRQWYAVTWSVSPFVRSHFLSVKIDDWRVASYHDLNQQLQHEQITTRTCHCSLP